VVSGVKISLMVRSLSTCLSGMIFLVCLHGVSKM
jgi:hypothetical protein